LEATLTHGDFAPFAAAASMLTSPSDADSPFPIRGIGQANPRREVLNMGRGIPTRLVKRTAWLFLAAPLYATSLVPPANSQPRRPQDELNAAGVTVFASIGAEIFDEKSASRGDFSIPPGTILPVRLNPTISSANSRPGQVITGRIMQDVPLPAEMKIREGSEVIGHVVDVIPATAGAGARISLQFDKLVSSHQTISIATNLRAIAGFMRVIEAQTPRFGAGEGEVFRWLTTVQIGGDVVYGAGGPVVAGDAGNQIVGSAVNGGVLSQVRAKKGTLCWGAIDGNDAPQALWVFSSDACGAYGLEHINIVHSGRTNPTAVIVLASDTGEFKIRNGAGMLLRVNAIGHK